MLMSNAFAIGVAPQDPVAGEEPTLKRSRYNSREDLVRYANKGYPGLITYKNIGNDEHWQCNYCLAQRARAKRLREMPRMPHF